VCSEKYRRCSWRVYVGCCVLHLQMSLDWRRRDVGMMMQGGPRVVSQRTQDATESKQLQVIVQIQKN